MSAATLSAPYAVHAGGYAFVGGRTSPDGRQIADRLSDLITELSTTAGSDVRKILCWITDEDDRADVRARLAATLDERTVLTILCGSLPGGADGGVEVVCSIEEGEPGLFSATAGLAIDRATTTRLAEAVDMATEVQIVWDTITKRVAGLGASRDQIVKATAYLDDIADHAEFEEAYSRLAFAPTALFVSQIGVTGGCRVQIEVLILQTA